MIGEGDDRFRTAPPSSPERGGSVVDSYTGLSWCLRGLHLLDDVNRNPKGRCRQCDTRQTRYRRRRKNGQREYATLDSKGKVMR